jgi:hypothetical protein
VDRLEHRHKLNTKTFGPGSIRPRTIQLANHKRHRQLPKAFEDKEDDWWERRKDEQNQRE